MQHILCIDLSSHQAQAVIVKAYEGTIEVLDYQCCECDLWPLNGHPQESTESNPVGTSPPTEQGIKSHPFKETINTQDNTNSSQNGSTLTRLLNGIKIEWSTAVLILPPQNYLSLNLTLPFRDQRSISKVIELEVQDVVPFNLDEFVVQYQISHRITENLSQLHIGLLPRNLIAESLKICREVGLEPLIITTPTGALSTLYHLDSTFAGSNSALLWYNNGSCHLCYAFNGQIRGDAVLNYPLTGQDTLKLVERLKLHLTGYEHLFEIPIERLYVVGEALKDLDLATATGYQTEYIDPTRLVAHSQDENIIACLAATLAQDTQPAPLFNNFRVREFRYHPQLNWVKAGLRKVLPHATLFMAVLLLCLLGTYLFRQYQIEKMHEAASEQIVSAAPSLAPLQSDGITALQNENERLETELRTLGSPSKLSPLDAFAQISRDFPVLKADGDVSVARLQITSSSIIINGVAPNYQVVSKIKRALKRQKDYYCNVEESISGSSPRVNFTFTIKLCDE